MGLRGYHHQNQFHDKVPQLPNEKEIPCEYCSKNFISPSKLKKHKRTVHSNIDL